MANSAVQNVDFMLGNFANGLAAGIDAFRASQEENRRIEAHNERVMSIHRQNETIHTNNQAKLDYWKNYALEMESKVSKLATEGQDLVARSNDLSTSRKDYIELLNKRIDRMNVRIQHDRATAYADTQMCNRLLNELLTASDPQQSELLNPVKQLQLHQEDWQYFMEKNYPDSLNSSEVVPTQN